MKKKGINLLVDTYNYRRTELLFQRFRIAVFAYGFILIVLAFIAFMQSLRTNQEISRLLGEKESVITALTSKAAVEAQAARFYKKAEYVDRFLKDDAHFLPYYNLLVDTLEEATASVSLDYFQIDKNRNSEFRILFPSFDRLTAFFRLVEEDKFLKKFQSLTLDSFSAGSTGLKNYELSFHGTFNIINEPKN